MKEENKKNKTEKNDDVVMILPGGVPQVKPVTLFLLGVVASTILITTYYQLSESLVLIAFGVIVFLFIFDEGFRKLF